MRLRRAIAVFVVVAGLTAGLCKVYAKEGDEELYKYYDLFVQVLTEIQDKYYGDAPDLEKLFYGAMDGMVSQLDPYSSFEPPDVHAQVEIDTVGKFGGLGMEITMDSDSKYIKVVTPLEGTPAFRAGILPGDRIIKIEKELTRGMSSAKAANMMRGPKGTNVTITVVHEGDTKPIEMTMARDIIQVESVNGFERNPTGGWNYMMDAEAGIGYVRIVQFQENTPEEVQKVVQGLLDQGMKALLIDLRFNPGGVFGPTVRICDLFLDAGKIVTMKGRYPSQSKDFLARKAGTFPRFPIAILVNRATASSSEILSAALQDNNRAIVVGERTLGKGKVQTLLPLEDGHSALRLTTAEYLTPSGKSIARPMEETKGAEWGIKPDIEITLSDEDLLALFEHRRDMHILKTPSPTPTVSASPSPAKPEAKEETKEQKPFVDVQLEAAVSAVKGALQYGKTLAVE